MSHNTLIRKHFAPKTPQRPETSQYMAPLIVAFAKAEYGAALLGILRGGQ